MPTVSTTSTPENIPKSSENEKGNATETTEQRKNEGVNLTIQTEEIATMQAMDNDAGTKHGGGNGAARRLELSPPLKWVDVAAGKTLTVKGAALKFVPPLLKKGKKVATLDQDEVNKLFEPWSTAIILYVVGQTPTIGALTRYIEYQWNHVSKPKIFLHDRGYFIVKFASIYDRNEILYAGPRMINSRPMVLKTWTPDFDF